MPSSYSPFTTTTGSASENVAFPDYFRYTVSAPNHPADVRPLTSAAPPLGLPVYPLPSQLLQRYPVPFANTNPPSTNGDETAEMGDRSNLFSVDRKRKLLPPEEFRTSKVFITEAKLVASLSDLQLSSGDGNTSESSSTLSLLPDNAAPQEADSWENFRDSNFMEVDEPSSGRRSFPQLEMSESLKEAIRQVEREEADLLPPDIRSTIAPSPFSSICMAVIPYVPPEELPTLLPDNLARRQALKRTESRTEASSSPKRQHLTRPPSNEDFQMTGQ